MITYQTPCYKFRIIKEPNMKAARCKIQSSSCISEYMKAYHYADDISVYESFWIILLNNANNTMGSHLISSGSITGCLVDIRLIAKYALEVLATSIILVHNHPSGNLHPSEADKQITKKIMTGLENLDIKVLDHIIVTDESYFSFADEGLL